MTMILRILAVVAILSAAIPAGAKDKVQPARMTADSVFIKLPVDVLEVLTPSTRMDMLDYYAADSIYMAGNLLDGISQLEKVTADYLKVKLTDVSSLEIKILPLRKGGDIAAVSYTVDNTGQQPDSELFFFDAGMRPIPMKKVFKAPEVKHFFHIDKGSLTTEKELVEMVEFPLVHYTFSPDDSTLKAELVVGDYIDVDDYNIMKLFLLPSIEWEWNGTKYKRVRR